MIQGTRHPDAGEGRPQEVSPCCAWLLRRLEALELELQRLGFRRQVFNDTQTGLVPATGGVGATYFLNGLGAWSLPGGGAWGSITGTLSSQTDLQAALTAKADKNFGNTDPTPLHTETSPAGTDVVVIWQSGIPAKLTLSDLKTYVNAP